MKAVQIAREDAEAELAENGGEALETREFDLDPSAIWETMNPRDILYAGEFDQ